MLALGCWSQDSQIIRFMTGPLDHEVSILPLEGLSKIRTATWVVTDQAPVKTPDTKARVSFPGW